MDVVLVLVVAMFCILYPDKNKFIVFLKIVFASILLVDILYNIDYQKILEEISYISTQYQEWLLTKTEQENTAKMLYNLSFIILYFVIVLYCYYTWIWIFKREE